MSHSTLGSGGDPSSLLHVEESSTPTCWRGSQQVSRQKPQPPPFPRRMWTRSPRAPAGPIGGIPPGEDGGQLGRGQLHLTHGLQQRPGNEGRPSLHTEGQDSSPALLRGGPWTGTGCSPGQEDSRTEWDTASLAAQGLGIRTSAGTGLDPRVWDPTGRGAAKSTRPSALEPVVWRSHGDEKPDTATREPACGEDRVRRRPRAAKRNARILKWNISEEME